MQKHKQIYGSTTRISPVIQTDSESFKFKSGLSNNTGNAGTVNIEVAMPLKYFWRTFIMPLINCKINLMLNWSTNCVICEADRASAFQITTIKIYIPAVIL